MRREEIIWAEIGRYSFPLQLQDPLANNIVYNNIHYYGGCYLQRLHKLSMLFIKFRLPVHTSILSKTAFAGSAC